MGKLDDSNQAKVLDTEGKIGRGNESKVLVPEEKGSDSTRLRRMGKARCRK